MRDLNGIPNCEKAPPHCLMDNEWCHRRRQRRFSSFRQWKASPRRRPSRALDAARCCGCPGMSTTSGVESGRVEWPFSCGRCASSPASPRSPDGCPYVVGSGTSATRSVPLHWLDRESSRFDLLANVSIIKYLPAVSNSPCPRIV